MKKIFAIALIGLFTVAFSTNASAVDTDSNIEYVVNYDSPSFVAVATTYVPIGSVVFNVTVEAVGVASVEGLTDGVNISLEDLNANKITNVIILPNEVGLFTNVINSSDEIKPYPSFLTHSVNDENVNNGYEVTEIVKEIPSNVGKYHKLNS